MKAENEMWSISLDEEYFNEEYFFDTKEEAIEFGKSYDDFEGRSFWVGKVKEVKMMCDELAIDVLEKIQDLHYNEDEEFAETYLDDVKREHISELDTAIEMAILRWAEAYDYLPNYFKVTNIGLVECEVYKSRMEALRVQLGFSK